MVEWFSQIEFWHWLSLGFVLLILEMLAPSTLFLWMGVSAIAVSLVQWLIPDISWQWQFILFGVLSLVTFFGWRRWSAKKGLDNVPEEYAHLNQRSASLIGRKAVLESPIVNGVGRMRLDDTYWRIEGDDLPAGTRVIVVGVEGATLEVKAIE
jgi:hypothetical protein